MARLSVKKGQLKRRIAVPPSKSHTLRAILFGLMGRGMTVIHNPLLSSDTEAAMKAIAHFGARVQRHEGRIEIEGVAGKLAPAEDVIDAANSGIILRFVAALAALIPTYTVITGDASIRHLRPVLPLLQGLRQLGAFAESARLDGYAPIIIRGPMKVGKVTMQGVDSQPVSALLIAAAFLQGETEIEVISPGEKPWIDLTLSWLDRLQIRYAREDYTRFKLEGSAAFDGFTYTVPGDFSSAAFPLAAALVTGSEVVLENLDFTDVQGDKKLIAVLQKMGANIEITEKDVIVKKSKLHGCVVDVNDFVDAVPILSVIACFAEGQTEIHGAAIARQKESDRISAVSTELKKMGAQIEERADGLLIANSPLHAAELFSHHDHRIALSLAVAALGAKESSTIDAFECVSKTYPTFCRDLGLEKAK